MKQNLVHVLEKSSHRIYCLSRQDLSIITEKIRLQTSADYSNLVDRLK